MKRFISSFFFLALIFVNISGGTSMDSIRQEMKQLKGARLLDAYDKLCGLAFAQEDSLQELTFLDAYIEEVHKQKNIEAEAYARNSKLICFYNYDMEDELIAALPSHLDFLASHRLWDKYYSSWSLLVDMNIYGNKYQTALREAREIYADARKRNINYGLGVASYNIGNVYHHMQNVEESEKAYKKAIQILSKEEDMTVLMFVYENYAEILSGKSDYERMRQLTVEWKGKLDLLKSIYKKKGYLASELNSKYRYCYEAMAEVAMETGDMQEALRMLGMADELTKGHPPIARLKLLREYARYYELMKAYDKALAYNLERMELNLAMKNHRGLLDAKEQRAALLMSAGRNAEAAEIYQKIIPVRDSLASAQTAEQLNELSTLYRFDELTLEKKMATTRFYLSLIIVALLVLAVASYIIYTRRLRRKNRILYDTIQQLQKVNPFLEIGQEGDGEQDLDNEGILFRKLLCLMQNDEVFKDPLLRRDTLVRLLNTNHVYLANAIRKYADNATINDFINGYRLRYAGNLLANNPNLNISEVEYSSGFNSRTTFGRLFRDYYGMSPSEYKAISQEKKSTLPT